MRKKIRLVIGGTGLLFPVSAGAVLKLWELGFDFVETLGISGGSIIGTALSSGMSVNRLIHNISQIRIDALLDWYWPKGSGLIFPSSMALMEGGKIEKALCGLLPFKFKDLSYPAHVLATDIENFKSRVFNIENSPSLEVGKAIRASLSIPLIFKPIKIDSSLLVDGGLLNNFPISYFHEKYGTSDNIPTFGIRTLGSTSYVPSKVGNIFDLGINSLNCLLSAQDNANILDSPFKENVIECRSRFSGTDFSSFNKNQISNMIDEGYSSVENFFKYHKDLLPWI